MTPRPSRTNPAEKRLEFSQLLGELAETPPLSVALLDIDGFKSVNDSHGHAAGDRFIQTIEQQLTKRWGADSWIRTGGDEWACAYPETSPEEALMQLEELRAALAQTRVSAGKQKLPVMISAGIASFPQHAEDPAQLPEAADAALHRAKRDGRNRVRIYVEDKMVLKSNYYSRAQLGRLASLSQHLRVTEAALLREALADLLERHRDAI